LSVKAPLLDVTDTHERCKENFCLEFIVGKFFWIKYAFLMTSHTEDNKRIAKNTVMLYLRMFLIMGVSLYTSRVVLQVLGVTDYGIYNVVGGVVSLFSFIHSAMTSATQRYITFALGKEDQQNLHNTFCTSLNIHAFIALVLVVLAETIGLWFLNVKMTIPIERMRAANWVYQMSVLSTVILIMSSPYNALIIAHEKMSAFAYISIIDVFLKLAIVFVLKLFGADKLVLYAILVFFVQFLIRCIYTFYCKKHFVESKYRFIWDKPLTIEMLSYSLWSLWGNLAAVFANHGVNIVLNMFFGPAVNAARGVTMQVKNAIHGFSSNFQMAMNPQITKNYAKGDLRQMHTLVYASSKYSYFLLFILSFPIFIEAPTILDIWLDVVPEHSVTFLRIVLLISLIQALAGPLTVSAQANGNIKKYQAIVGGILLLTLPFSYIGLRIWKVPELVFWVDLAITLIAQVIRLIMVRPMVGLSIRSYFSEVISRVFYVTVLSIIAPVLLYFILPNKIWSMLLICFICVVSVATCVYYVGLTTSERGFVIAKVKSFLHSKFSK